MKEEIKNAEIEIASLYRKIRDLESFIEAARKICKHDQGWTLDSVDYHKNEKFNKCNICGKVV